MKFVDLIPHKLLCFASETQFSEMMHRGKNDPVSLQYHLDDGTVVNIELTVPRFTELLLKLSMPLQKDFWKGIMKEIPEDGTVGKLVVDKRYIATFVRLKTDDGSVGFRVSP